MAAKRNCSQLSEYYIGSPLTKINARSDRQTPITPWIAIGRQKSIGLVILVEYASRWYQIQRCNSTRRRVTARLGKYIPKRRPPMTRMKCAPVITWSPRRFSASLARCRLPRSRPRDRKGDAILSCRRGPHASAPHWFHPKGPRQLPSQDEVICENAESIWRILWNAFFSSLWPRCCWFRRPSVMIPVSALTSSAPANGPKGGRRIGQVPRITAKMISGDSPAGPLSSLNKLGKE